MDMTFHHSATSVESSVVAIGNFDGVHVGHQRLLQQAKQLADSQKVPLVMVTFEPMPREFFAQQAGSEYRLVRLQRLSEKWRCLQAGAVDTLFVIRLSSSVARWTPEEFVFKVLVQQLGAQSVVVGDDFRFGRDRVGDVNVLSALGQQQGFSVQVVDTVNRHGRRVSSSAIRALLQAGDLDLAAAYLGRPYSLTSRVVMGDQRGRQWGFPTINMPLFRDKAPLVGIFAVSVQGEDFSGTGVASIGYRPVFKLKRPLLEVFIFDFNREVYGQRVQVNFLHKIRDEMDFESVDSLIEQIRRDVTSARRYFSSLD